MNQIFLIGRLTSNLELKEENERKICKFTLAVHRDFKNEEGIYETDFIKCVSRDTIAEKICEYCKKGDLVSVKGRIENLWEDNLDYEIIAEKLSFLSSSKGE